MGNYEATVEAVAILRDARAQQTSRDPMTAYDILTKAILRFESEIRAYLTGRTK